MINLWIIIFKRYYEPCQKVVIFTAIATHFSFIEIKQLKPSKFFDGFYASR